MSFILEEEVVVSAPPTKPRQEEVVISKPPTKPRQPTKPRAPRSPKKNVELERMKLQIEDLQNRVIIQESLQKMAKSAFKIIYDSNYKRYKNGRAVGMLNALNQIKLYFGDA